MSKKPRLTSSCKTCDWYDIGYWAESGSNPPEPYPCEGCKGGRERGTRWKALTLRWRKCEACKGTGKIRQIAKRE